MNNDYYQQHAERFFTETVTVDMSALYQPFVAHLKPGARILDAGCGSGRDAKAFHEMGYDVEAFDASAELVELARQHSGLPVEQKRFEDVTEVERYNGIWCCASLLHVPLAELPEVMSRLARALKPGGVWYLSFKYGSGEREKDGRVFTDMDEIKLNDLIADLENIVLLDTWITGDKRPERQNEKWLNSLLRKK
ncbi:class I SAM-dependent methyltransferase [Erwinia rhapontici]|uniref:class I SAM-dependent methyltransferase n=1 Tax=Erwinia rhapontici TaxID=55212 RepID=UPI0014386CFE|nr:class I SAM-dependent methyltransferase [Erwinia rhapontici]NKG29176.1 class I SAM-dependent methyltransferase [Erwinia rhapontici]